MAYTAAQLTAAYTAANNGVAPDQATTAALLALATQSQAGQVTDQAALSFVINSADNDVSVAVQAYQFFTGKTPTKAGLDFLVNSPTNSNDLNDAYYAQFGLENRYINFAVNLGVLGEGAAAFNTTYGGLTFDAFVSTAYQTIIGSSYALAAGLNPTAAIADITSRKANFEAIARQAGVINAASTAAQVDIAIKAALIGYLMGEGVKADVGIYAAGANNFVNALVSGNAQYNVNLTTVYTPLGGGTGSNITPPAAPPPSGPTNQAFTLTTAANTFAGGEGDDTYTGYIDTVGANSTLNATDVLNAAGGTDTLVLTVDGVGAGAFPAATITGIEVFKINETGGTAGTYDFVAVTGETSVINNKSTDAVTFSNIGTGASLAIVGDGAITNGATTFSMAAGTDAVTLNLQGGLKGGANITRNQTGAATVVINSTGGANVIGVIDLDTATALTGLTINAATNLTGALAADYAAASTLTVTGAGQVDLSAATLSTNFSKVDSSAQTAGGVLVKVGALTQFVGGAGNDSLYVDALVYSNPAITAAGGGGTDTVRFTDQAALTATTALYLTGFEVLSLADDNDATLDTFDASLMTGILSVTVAADSAADGYSVINLSAVQAAAITITGSQTVAPTFVLANAAGGTDVLSIAINDGLTAVNTLTLANLNVVGVETVNLALTDNLTLSSLTGVTGFTKIAVTGAGALNLTTGALAINPASTIDASASTGTVILDASGGTANGLTIKGSATQANTITGTNQDDTIVGGTGVDIVKNQANAATDSDTVNFVSDTAVDIFEVTTLTGKTTISNFDAATTVTAEDLINVSNNAVDGSELAITAAAVQGVLGNDRTIVIEQALGTAAALTTAGTATLTGGDFTAGVLTNLATYLSERFTADNADTVAGNQAILFVLNNGADSYVYAFSDSATQNATIDADELTLVGVLTGSLLDAGDVFQTI